MHRHQKKQERNKKIMGWTVIIVMLFSIVGFLFGSYGGSTGTETFRYGDFKFEQTQQGYLVDINGDEQSFTYLPDQVSDILLSSVLQQALQAPSIKLTYDDSHSRKEDFATLHFYLRQNLDSFVQLGTLSGGTLDQITCADATPTIPVISLVNGSYMDFIEQGNCVTISTSNSYEIVRLYDKLRYELYGVPPQ